MIAGGHLVGMDARRASRSMAAVAALVFLAAPARAQSPVDASQPPGAIGKRIAVLGFDALGMAGDKVARLEALFRMELERLAGAPTPSRREIARALRSSPLRRCAGENGCLGAIGKKLGVDLVVVGNVAALGDSYVINVKAVASSGGVELRRIASDPLRGNPDELIDAIRVAAYRLLAPERMRGAVSILADIGGADVLLDGRPVGVTPLRRPIEHLSLGRHRLEVKAAGYSAFADDVEVRFQKSTRVVVRLVADPIRTEGGQGRRDGRRMPAARRWYQSAWFLVGAGAAAIVVGGAIGYSLSHQDVIDCSGMEEECR